ncbi:MAG: DUF2019 domain-containing protein [Planctomycetaceae bacterium]|nr:DUF2019 domain-containing protein [Planctomycetaceae bacterium]
MDANDSRMDVLVDSLASLTLRREAMNSVSKKNKVALEHAAAFDELVKDFGNDGREGMKRLMRHESFEVRKMAALYLLRYCHDEAKQVLQQIAELDELEAGRIDWIMRLWYSGNWELDPGPIPENTGFGTQALFPD